MSVVVTTRVCESTRVTIGRSTARFLAKVFVRQSSSSMAAAHNKQQLRFDIINPRYIIFLVNLDWRSE
jgi:hypothetical protein